jgi:hypothetical protein
MALAELNDSMSCDLIAPQLLHRTQLAARCGIGEVRISVGFRR